MLTLAALVRFCAADWSLMATLVDKDSKETTSGGTTETEESESETSTGDESGSGSGSGLTTSKGATTESYSRSFVRSQHIEKCPNVKESSLRGGPAPEKEEEEKEVKAVAASVAEERRKEQQAANGSRKVFVMRHAERLDRIFPGWQKLAFNEYGKYHPYDLNQPLSMPRRSGGLQDFHNDSPITEMGYVSSQMIGRAMRVSHCHPSVIYASPALRCIQTAHGILKTLAKKPKIRVEPGLFEWMAWYATPPKWMSADELEKAGYEVDTSYKPVMSEKQLLDKRAESSREHYERCLHVVKQILAGADQERSGSASGSGEASGSVLLVGHGTTVDSVSRGLLGRPMEQLSRVAMDKVGLHFPYCALVGLEQTSLPRRSSAEAETDSQVEHKWRPMHSPLPPITYLEFSNRINYQFLNR